MRFLALLMAAFVVIVAVIVGIQIADGWQARHTDNLIGGGLVIGGVCAVAAIVVPLVAMILRFMAPKRSEVYGPPPPPVSAPQTMDAFGALRYQTMLANSQRAQLALERDQQKMAAAKQTVTLGKDGMIEDVSIWEPSQGTWVDDTT